MNEVAWILILGFVLSWCLWGWNLIHKATRKDDIDKYDKYIDIAKSESLPTVDIDIPMPKVKKPKKREMQWFLCSRPGCGQAMGLHPNSEQVQCVVCGWPIQIAPEGWTPETRDDFEWPEPIQSIVPRVKPKWPEVVEYYESDVTPRKKRENR